MVDPDPERALEFLKIIAAEFSVFVETNGAAGATDTRVKLIDRVLKEVCCWPESAIERETHTNAGFMDYKISVRGRPLICLEAKREGIHFVLPATNKGHRWYQLDGVLVTEQDIRTAIEQVRSYCDEGGIRYAVATNGSTWIFFKADREDEKLHRLAARFKRVSQFLEYLQAEEQLERTQFRLKANSPLFGAEIVPKMRAEFGRERDWIERRVRENRERYAEELEENRGDPEDGMLPPLEEALEGPEADRE